MENEEKQQTNDNWLNEELDKISEDKEDRLPSLILEENKIVEIVVDYSQPFKSWKDPESSKVKKLVPVKVGEVNLIWWINVKNPIYTELIKRGMEGQSTYKILQTGKNDKTKYSIVEE